MTQAVAIANNFPLQLDFNISLPLLVVIGYPPETATMPPGRLLVVRSVAHPQLGFFWSNAQGARNALRVKHGLAER